MLKDFDTHKYVTDTLKKKCFVKWVQRGLIGIWVPKFHWKCFRVELKG